MAPTILITGATGLIGFRILVTALAAGHKVRYTVRSEEKAQAVSSNPAVQQLAPGDRLSSVIIPDFTADGAFDEALRGVTHIIHAGSPVPVPEFDPLTQVFEPTVKITSNLLSSALKTPSVQRVVITSSIVGNLGLGTPPTTAISAARRVPLPSPVPSNFDKNEGFRAYTVAKMVELHNSDDLVKTQNPHFTVSHVVPGYTFGRNELMRDAGMMAVQNSSNNFLMISLLGGEIPDESPLHACFAHVDDVAEVHLRVALLDPEAVAEGPTDYAIATKVDFETVFDHVKKAFPKAVAAGELKKGKIASIPVEYDSSDAQKLLGGELKSFESAVVDVAGQYLEKLGKEKA